MNCDLLFYKINTMYGMGCFLPTVLWYRLKKEVRWVLTLVYLPLLLMLKYMYEESIIDCVLHAFLNADKSLNITI